MSKALRVVTYVRYSPRPGSGELTLAVQRAKLEAWATWHDATVVGSHTDELLSGASLDRPGIRAALADLESGRADALLVAKLDRLTRSTRDLAALVETHFSGRFGLLSAHEQIDTRTPQGRFFLTMLGGMAQLERETIVDRTRDALGALRARGVKLGAAPLGKRHTAERDHSGRCVLAVDDAETATVERIRSLRAEGATLDAIAATLTAEGRRTKRGGRWHGSTVRAVLARID